MRVLVIAALVLVALSGCAERSDAISAKQGLGPALDAARAHGDDPVLVGISSVEPLKHLQEEDFEVWVHLDKNPGDGMAPGWMYTFASGDRLIGIVYAAGLGVIAEGYAVLDEEEWGYESGEPITDWRIDSTQAARILADLEDWPARSDDTTVFWELWQEEDGPVWFVEWSTANESYEVAIDARTGNVSHIERWETWEMAEEISCTSAILTGGSVTPLQGRSLEIEVQDGAGLDYGYAWDMTVGEATLTITGPSGEIESETVDGSGRGGGGFFDLEGGMYTMAFEAALGVGEVSSMWMSSC